MVDKRLLKLLRCPECIEPVKLEGEKLVCEKCGRRYPIHDDIPVMLLDEAESPEEQK